MAKAKCIVTMNNSTDCEPTYNYGRYGDVSGDPAKSSEETLWFEGADWEEWEPFQNPDAKNQALHIQVSPEEVKDLNEFKARLRKIADYFGRQGFQVIKSIRRDTDRPHEKGKIHGHIVVNRMNKRTGKMMREEFSDERMNEFWRGAKKLWGDIVIEKAKEPKDRPDRPRTGHAHSAFDRFRALDSKAEDWARDEVDFGAQELADLRQQMSRDREELREIYAAIPAKLATLKTRVESLRGSTGSLPMPIDRPPILTEEEWKEYREALARHLPIPMYILLKLWMASQTQRTRPPLILPDRELETLAAEYRELLERRENLRQNIGMARLRKVELQTEKHAQTIEQQRQFFGEMKVTAVLMDYRDGKKKSRDAKKIALSTEQDVTRAMPYLRSLNAKGYEIFFQAPHEQGKSRFVSLDDLDESQRRNVPRSAMLINTSPNRWTGFIRLDRPVEKEEWKAVQKAIGADTGNYLASRLIGFKNWKRGGAYVSLASRQHGTISRDALLAAIDYRPPKAQRPAPALVSSTRADATPRSLAKRWNDYAVYGKDGKLDSSRSDFRYALALIDVSGLPPEEVAERLKAESPQRSKNAAYWLYTATKAAAEIAKTGRKSTRRGRSIVRGLNRSR